LYHYKCTNRENAIIGAISNNDLLKLGMSSHKYGSWVESLHPMNSSNKIKKENDITFSNDCLKTKFLLTWNQVHLGRDRGAQVWTRLAHLRDTSVNFKNARKNDKLFETILHPSMLSQLTSSFSVSSMKIRSFK
jgi:hypothetical protein